MLAHEEICLIPARAKKKLHVIQINLQPHFGGAEIYTKFLCRALDRLDVATTLIHLDKASYWRGLGLPPSTTLRAVTSVEAVAERLPAERTWILCHGQLPAQIAEPIKRRHLLTAIAHMPPQGRASDRYVHFDLVFGVSQYVLNGLHEIGVPVWDTPLLGIADLNRRSDGGSICQTSCYDWDRRKGRDRLLAMIEPVVEPLRQRPQFHRRPGITLGIVSRLTPIKQFPVLFEILAPILAADSNVNLEIFGAGGYASVRDLRRALRSMGNRARFWGHQHDVAAAYGAIDYLMTGLPEKEALGLNVIEAQACDTPVLAVDAPPFTETVIDGQTGFLYRDPREDEGASFSELFARIAEPAIRPHPVAVRGHLTKFSFDAFVARLQPIVAAMEQSLQTGHV